MEEAAQRPGSDQEVLCLPESKGRWRDDKHASLREEPTERLRSFRKTSWLASPAARRSTAAANAERAFGFIQCRLRHTGHAGLLAVFSRPNAGSFCTSKSAFIFGFSLQGTAAVRRRFVGGTCCAIVSSVLLVRGVRVGRNLVIPNHVSAVLLPQTACIPKTQRSLEESVRFLH